MARRSLVFRGVVLVVCLVVALHVRVSRNAPVAGVRGLLPFLKDKRPDHAQRRNIRDLGVKRVGVDGLCWIHAGATKCAEELLLGLETDVYVRYVLDMIDVLTKRGIDPVVVFDGDRLPAKQEEEKNRREHRQRARLEAMELLQRKADGEEISDYTIRRHSLESIQINGQIIEKVIEALRSRNVEVMQAPYEADAQLAYLCREGLVDAVISEDSDLLAYGCPKVLFKMDRGGNADLYQMPWLQRGERIGSPPIRADDLELSNPDEQKSAGDQTGTEGSDVPAKDRRNIKWGSTKWGRSEIEWTHEIFVDFCVLLGCDYTDEDLHINGVGPVKAYQLLSEFGSVEQVVAWMREHENEKIRKRLPCKPDEFLERFRRATGVFWLHHVFDPRSADYTTVADSDSFPRYCHSLQGEDMDAIYGPRPQKNKTDCVTARNSRTPLKHLKKINGPTRATAGKSPTKLRPRSRKARAAYVVSASLSDLGLEPKGADPYDLVEQEQEQEQVSKLVE